MYKKFLLIAVILLPLQLMAQWPKSFQTQKGIRVSVYQPQLEKLKGNLLSGRSAFSVYEKEGDEPQFGVLWFDAVLSTDRDDRSVELTSISVKDIKLPGFTDTTRLNKFKTILETEIPTWKIEATMDEIAATIEVIDNAGSLDLNTKPPIIIYKNKPTTLILIDGEPVLKDDEQLKMKRVINTAFLIVEDPTSKKYYLYGAQHWYVSASLKDGYKVTTSLPSKIKSLNDEIVKKQKEDPNYTPATNTGVASDMLISISPAEIIQSSGAASFASIAGTNLLYVSNSEDDIFKNINDQKYYVLIAGRWYVAPKLEGEWTFIASDKLPDDFNKIPEGSDKDNVLASVAGTDASKEAVMDAQIPQTAKVDRKTATCTVKYDGTPKFEKIEGTSLELAVNTSSTVVKSGVKYYCVETGIWFVADKPEGPWKVSDERPKDVEKIPASSPAYNVQYVYIYDSTPDVVYVGYTPGYMGCYVYGTTVVYGTGYYYNPWYGPYYYPRPVTYGFSMHYNPWTGWSMGFHYSTGFFTVHVHTHPGYWGPHAYRPPYYAPYRGGMYGHHGPTYINNNVNINVNNSNNIYNNRKDVSTRDVKRGDMGNGNMSNRPSTMDEKNRSNNNRSGNAGAGSNKVLSDKEGNVYRQNDKGNWDERNGNEWKEKKEQPSNLNRDGNAQDRSQQHNNNYQQSNRGGNMGGGQRQPSNMNGGGGMQRSGGGGGGRRR